MNLNLETVLYVNGLQSHEWPLEVRETTFATKNFQFLEKEKEWEHTLNVEMCFQC